MSDSDWPEDWEQMLEKRFPSFDWRTPLPVSTVGARGLACRFCIARFGLHGAQVESLPQTDAEFHEHMHRVHGKLIGSQNN